MAISSNSVASTENLETELSPLNTNNVEQLALDLAEPLEIEIDGEKKFAWDLAGYSKIVKIYSNYIFLLQEHYLASEVINISNLQIATYKKHVELQEQKIAILKEDRDHTHLILERSQRMWARNHRRQKIKIILISTGTGIGAAAFGFVIGFFSAR